MKTLPIRAWRGALDVRYAWVPRLVPALALLLAIDAGATVPLAAPGSEEGDEATDQPRRKLVFPPRAWRRDAGQEDPEPEAPPAPERLDEGADQPALEVGPDADAPAEEPQQDSVWAWVERLEGEIPSAEQVEAIGERAEAELSERALIDRLSGGEVPASYYADPAGALAVHPLFLDQVDPSEFDIPITVNAEVEKWVRYFNGPGRKYYARWLSRSTRYRPMMYRELEAAGLPRDLVYLSMIESGYNAHAYSHAAAAGLWQFIPSTAKLYKLRVDWWVDDRRDPEASLTAAITFLSELHRMFGSWELAWAAYNGGPGRIRRSIAKAGTKDFWKIAEGPYLHSETDNYVPKIMAAAIIGKHPERYGFTDIRYQDELVYETAKVDGSVSLEVLARAANTSVDQLKALNPALRRFATPPEGYHVRLPVGARDRVAAALKEIPVEKRVTVARHTVSRGETLSLIAERYGVSVHDLSQANGLKNVDRIYVGMSLVVPVAGAAPQRVAAAATPQRRTDATPPKVTSHTVRRGDTLSGIASRHRVSVDDLRKWNGLSGTTILVGQTLKVHGSGAPASTSGGSSKTYTVQRGDTLSGIAARHNVRTADLQRWNGIQDPSTIRIGQTLKIGGAAAPSSSWSTYTVKSGDSLGAIATRNGCTVQQLKEWNGLSSTVIHPGQKLKIRG